MKKILIILLLLIFRISQAQEDINLQITKSEIIKEQRRLTFLIASSSDGNGGVISVQAIANTLGLYVKEYKVNHYDKDLKLIKTVSIPNKFTEQVQGVFFKNGTINLIKLTYSKKGISTYVMTGSISDLKFSSKLIHTLPKNKYRKLSFVELYQDPHEQNTFANGINKGDSDMFGSVSISENHNFFALSFDIKNKEKVEEHLFVVFDASNNKIFEKSFRNNDKDRLFRYKNIDLDDKDGSIYLLGKVFENGRKRNKIAGKINYHFSLYKINSDSQLNLEIKETSKFITSMKLVHHKDKLVLVGFYILKKAYKGVCRYDISEELKITNSSFQPFSEQFFKDKYTDAAIIKDKNKVVRRPITIRSVFVDDENNVIINAEEFYIVKRYNARGEISQVIYHYDDIIAIKLDNQGKIVWARNINKAQKRIKNSSFSAIYANGKDYIFLNAADKIKEYSKDVIAFKKSGVKASNLYVIVLDGDGEFNYKKIIDNEESEVWYTVFNGLVDLKNNTIFFEGSKGKLKRLIKIEIE